MGNIETKLTSMSEFKDKENKINQKNSEGNRVGLWEEYWSSGNLSSKGEFNSDGERIGLWEYYHYYTGKLWMKGNYSTGKRIGMWEIYHDNGQLRSKEYYI